MDLPHNPALALRKIARIAFPDRDVVHGEFDKVAAYCAGNEMTPLENAARALYRSAPLDFDPHQTGEDDTWPELVPEVLAVLNAIREPSVAMIDEAYASYAANGGSLRDVFMDMIDKAMGVE